MGQPSGRLPRIVLFFAEMISPLPEQPGPETVGINPNASLLVTLTFEMRTTPGPGATQFPERMPI